MVIRKEHTMGTKLKDDEALEKLFEGMSKEIARKVNNQGCPTKRAPIKKAPAKKANTKKK